MTDLFIASRRIPRPDDDPRRTIVTAAFIDGDVRVNGPRGATAEIAGALIAGRLERELAEAAVRGEP